MPQLFGVELPQTNKYELKTKLRRLKKTQKATLYFHYSEFLLRANRNPWYKAALNRATFSAIDGKGLHWAMWTIMRPGLLPRAYKYLALPLPAVLRMPIFGLLFPLQLGVNLFLGWLTLTLKYNYTLRTQNQVILGRDFVYDLLKMAEEENWKTLVLGGSSTSDQVTKDLINRLFPQLDLITWTRNSASLLMRDQPDPEQTQEILSSENVCQVFPDLWEAKQFIKQQKPDLILTCLGGASGKQEFFVDNLALDPEVSFLLATGLGAAVDHLGGGAKQTVAPKWMISMGLEWLHRFIHQPYRRRRVADSILTLWWWTTVEQFISQAKTRKTVVNILWRWRSEQVEPEFLLVKRKNVLPGDMGWTFVQGGMSPKETPEQTGKRELAEEVRLAASDVQTRHIPISGQLEPHTISLLRFLSQRARYKQSQNYLFFAEYTGTSLPTPNWENSEAVWVPRSQVHSRLSVEKRPDWLLAQKELLEILK